VRGLGCPPTGRGEVFLAGRTAETTENTENTEGGLGVMRCLVNRICGRGFYPLYKGGGAEGVGGVGICDFYPFLIVLWYSERAR
jgi:hypothetical protein